MTEINETNEVTLDPSLASPETRDVTGHIEPQELENEQLNFYLRMCRKERDMKLSETDWIHMPDVNISEELLQEYTTYRQALRDMPQTFTEWFNAMTEDEKYCVTPHSMPWPEKP